jgi:hypothetical protein
MTLSENRKIGPLGVPFGTNGLLFAYRAGDRHIPLTYSRFRARLHEACEAAGLEKLQGHGLRIGNTLEMLLRGLTLEAVKAKGRWSSDAFKRYLREHAEFLAPLIQASPSLRAEHEEMMTGFEIRR